MPRTIDYESWNLIKKHWKLKSDYASMSTSLKITANINTAGTTLPYPTGFDKNNCRVVWLMGYDQAQYGWYTPVGISTYKTYNLNAFLGSNGITLRVQKVSNFSTDYSVPISIGLMKII